MSIYKDIKEGLLQAIEYENGNLAANATVLSFAPIEKFSANEIIDIRNKANMSQPAFAKAIGVTENTVKAWESSKSHPSGSACRILALVKTNPDFFEDFKIISKS